MLGIWWLVIKPPWRVHYPLTRLEPQRIQGPERERKSERNRIAGNPEVFIGVISMARGSLPVIDAPGQGKALIRATISPKSEIRNLHLTGGPNSR
jgi:hypothetical protein